MGSTCTCCWPSLKNPSALKSNSCNGCCWVWVGDVRRSSDCNEFWFGQLVVEDDRDTDADDEHDEDDDDEDDDVDL